MGGLIARYAAMYGSADLPAGAPQPNWAGAKNFDKIFLLGTPNEGSIMSLNALLNGFSYIGGGLNLPFIQDISRFDAFTIPSIYQLLPHDGALLAYDENLKPMAIDLYDPAEWEKYGWAIWQDDSFTKKFDASEQKNARPFFNAALARAKQFQAALDAGTSAKPSVSFYLIGGDCKPTPASMLLLRDEKKNRWETHFKANGCYRPNGERLRTPEIGFSLLPSPSVTASLLRVRSWARIQSTVRGWYCRSQRNCISVSGITSWLQVPKFKTSYSHF